jgi:hypothetical protein
MCEYNVYAQCVQLGMQRSRSIALEGRLMNCFHGLPLQSVIDKTHKSCLDKTQERFLKKLLSKMLAMFPFS